MIAEAGLAALWLAAAMAALQPALAALALTRADGDRFAAPLRPVAIVQGALTATALVLLLRLFLVSDMSVQLVAEHSHSLLPWLDKFAAAVGSGPGAILWWLMVLGLAGGAVALLADRLPQRTWLMILGGQAAIALGLHVLLLLGANPFARLAVAPPDGAGLRSLHDPGLAVPPTLYPFLATLAVIALAATSPHLRWRRGPELTEQLTWPIAAAGAAFAGLTVFATGIGWVSMLVLTAAVGLAVASVLPLVQRDPRRIPLRVWASAVVQLGVATSLAGLASDHAFTVERQVVVGTAQPHRIGPFTVTLAGIRPTIGPGWSALETHLTVQRHDEAPFVLRPQSRYVIDPPAEMSPRAAATHWDGQLYAVLGEPQGGGRWRLRLCWKPFVTLIWLGGGLIVLGGLLALISRRRRDD